MNRRNFTLFDINLLIFVIVYFSILRQGKFEILNFSVEFIILYYQ